VQINIKLTFLQQFFSLLCSAVVKAHFPVQQASMNIRIKKVRSTGSLLGKKSASERRVLAEENPEEKQKSLRSSAQKTVSRNRKQP
jgi:hypothetical protein